MPMHYEVNGTVFGSKKVLYKCPKCGADLESPLDDAGKPDSCPTCGINYTVPGEKELAADRASKEAQKRQREHEEELRRQETERKRVQSLKHRAEKMLKKSQHQEYEDERLQKTTLADRVLRLAFKLCKYLSVFVVAICFLAIITSLVVLGFTFTDTGQQSIAPRANEYVSELNAKSRQDAHAGIQSSESNSSNTVSPLENEITVLAETYGLNRDILSSQIVDNMWDLPAYLDGLNIFMAEWAESSEYAKDDSLSALFWYDKKWKANKSEYKLAQDKTYATRWLMINSLVIATCILLAFLILPLLIQIERNTRMLLISK